MNIVQSVRQVGLIRLLILIRTPVFEWCVVTCGSKNQYQKDTCLKETGLKVLKIANNFRLNSPHNWGGDLYNQLHKKENLVHFDMSSKNYKEKGWWPQFGFASHLVLIACFNIPGEVGAELEFLFRPTYLIRILAMLTGFFVKWFTPHDSCLQWSSVCGELTCHGRCWV